MTRNRHCPHRLRLVGTITVAGPPRVSLNPCSYRFTAPDTVLAMGDLHPPRPGVWVTDSLVDSH